MVKLAGRTATKRAVAQQSAKGWTRGRRERARTEWSTALGRI